MKNKFKAYIIFICATVLAFTACTQKAEDVNIGKRGEASNIYYETIGYAELPTDKLFITETRSTYKDGEMVLKVPSLDLTVDVIAGVTNADLARGVGLFDQGQLPGVSNQNVSIAGHRDIYGAEFYEIDKMTKGDLLYLIYDDKEYVYEYEKTEIIKADDWSFVYCSDYSKISLMSCDPIGTTLNRIIVVGRLIQVNKLTQ